MAVTIRRLRWRQNPPPEGPPPLMRTQRWRQTVPAPARVPLHCHDFYEFFWVDEAAGRQPINGRSWRLSVGDIVFIRPSDVHGFGMIDGKMWGWTNVAIAAPVMTRLKRRYAGDMPDWPWRDGPMPLRLHLDERQRGELKLRVAALPVNISRWIDADWLITELLRLISHGPGHITIDHPPDWFTAAVDGFRRGLESGGDGGDFILHTGRGREHVNRVCRRYFGMTTTQYLNTLRLERAARLLRFTRRDVLTVAADCGFENLSYFHRRFKRQFGVTPRRFRMQEIGGP